MGPRTPPTPPQVCPRKRRISPDLWKLNFVKLEKITYQCKWLVENNRFISFLSRLFRRVSFLVVSSSPSSCLHRLPRRHQPATPGPKAGRARPRRRPCSPPTHVRALVGAPDPHAQAAAWLPCPVTPAPKASCRVRPRRPSRHPQPTAPCPNPRTRAVA